MTPSDFIICPTLWYSNGTDKNAENAQSPSAWSELVERGEQTGHPSAMRQPLDARSYSLLSARTG